MYLCSKAIYTDGMQISIRTLTISSLFTAALTACGDSAGETTVVTTVITTAGTDTSTPLPSTSTTGTTDASTDTEDATTSTGGIEPTSAGPTGSTTAYEPPEYCVENEDGETSAPVTCTPVADTWCDEVEAFAAEHLPEPYAGIAVANCEATGRLDPCGVCFYIVNTCNQVAGPCDYDQTMYECGCLARAHSMI